MNAIRELVDVKDGTVIIHLPDHFRARRPAAPSPPFTASGRHTHRRRHHVAGCGCRRLGRLEVILLDTHVWVRWLCPTADPLPLAMLETLETAGDLAVSAVSCWEVAYLAKRGRLVLPLPLATWLQAALAGSEI